MQLSHANAGGGAAEPFAARTAGRLTPRQGVRMTRLAPEPDVHGIVHQWWIPSWSLPDGEHADEVVLGYPVCNLVAEHGAARLHGPTTRASVKTLTDTGWAVGALLTPAAARHLSAVPLRRLVDADAPVGVAGDLGSVAAAHRTLRERLASVAAELDDDDHDAVRLMEIVESGTATHVPDLANAMHRSIRSLQRLCARNFGVTPAALIRRRRLQDAAARVREGPDVSLRDVAAEFGFADHAHLTREFAAVLGFTPSRYRGEG
ncbi:AraC family transcriptional regulator [Microbacterium halotolerans]|uniref:AraC family transcriptional regulator n=1 Tax=Microbacterium halotolerans TaxID=246613 RepID=UPI000E6A9928|nr:helix-turn-helix domain-containing protein [Microbacterium halotolerans]